MQNKWVHNNMRKLKNSQTLMQVMWVHSLRSEPHQSRLYVYNNGCCCPVKYLGPWLYVLAKSLKFRDALPFRDVAKNVYVFFGGAVNPHFA